MNQVCLQKSKATIVTKEKNINKLTPLPQISIYTSHRNSFFTPSPMRDKITQLFKSKLASVDDLDPLADHFTTVGCCWLMIAMLLPVNSDSVMEFW